MNLSQFKETLSSTFENLPLQKFFGAREKIADDVGQHCSCHGLVLFLSGCSGKSCSDSFGFSVRCLSVRILSVSILSGFSKLSCPFRNKVVRTRTRRRCPDFYCPCPPTSGEQFRTRTFRTTRKTHRLNVKNVRKIPTFFRINFQTNSSPWNIADDRFTIRT